MFVLFSYIDFFVRLSECLFFWLQFILLMIGGDIADHLECSSKNVASEWNLGGVTAPEGFSFIVIIKGFQAYFVMFSK